MAEATETQTAEAAEKVYAAASESLPVKAETAEAVALPEPVAAAPSVTEADPAPAKVRKPRAAKPVAAVEVAETASVEAAPKARRAKAVAAPARKKAAAKKAAAPKAAPTKAAAPRKAAAPKARQDKSPLPNLSLSKFKETIMATSKTTDFSAGLKNVMADVQAKAKEAFEKGTGAFGESGEFAKGNVEALVESGKIFTAGLQEMGSAYVAEAKTAFETMTADVKELAQVKSPVDFFKLQGEMLRRNFDAAVAAGSKNSEALLKLSNDAIAPISSRVSVAMEKARKAA